MRDLRLETLTFAGKKRFYALTFRKPGQPMETRTGEGSAGSLK
jgi:hypothetical protein